MPEKLLYDAKEPLFINNHRPVSDAFLNLFYGTINLAQIHRFEKLYRSLKTEIETINMGPQQFIAQLNGAFNRYQEHRRHDAFEAMDDKALKYVLEFMEKSIRDVAKEVQKNTAKSLIG
ncbi:MAG TPA: hypothetical protein PLY93_13690 [Turneriella sp.]|nr:hypothetical protein [Turneriella sp.]